MTSKLNYITDLSTVVEKINLEEVLTLNFLTQNCKHRSNFQDIIFIDASSSIQNVLLNNSTQTDSPN